MTSPQPNPEQLQRVAHELAERPRRGERPSLSDYIDKYPGLVDHVRKLLGEPTVTADPAAGAGSGSCSPKSGARSR